MTVWLLLRFVLNLTICKCLKSHLAQIIQVSWQQEHI